MADAWVINASPIILLAKAGLVDCLPRVTSPLVVPEAVAAEILRGPSSDPALLWLKSVGREFVRPPAPLPPALAQSAIGPGERAVLAWCLAHPEFIAVLDDRAARIQARQMGAVTIGTAGVLLRLKAAGVIERVEPNLAEIRRVGGHMSDELVGEILRQAGEAPPPGSSQR